MGFTPLAAPLIYMAAVVQLLEIANQVVQRCELPKVTLYVALYGLGQLIISLVAL